MKMAERLKELRIKAGQTQVTVADSIGVAEVTYQRYEYGTHDPIQKILIALTDHFNTSADYLLGRTDNPSPPQK